MGVCVSGIVVFPPMSLTRFSAFFLVFRYMLWFGYVLYFLFGSWFGISWSLRSAARCVVKQHHDDPAHAHLNEDETKKTVTLRLPLVFFCLFSLDSVNSSTCCAPSRLQRCFPLMADGLPPRFLSNVQSLSSDSLLGFLCSSLRNDGKQRRRK